MQDLVHLGSARAAAVAVSGLVGVMDKGLGKGEGVVASAFKTRAMTGGQSRYLIQEEELGIAGTHHLTLSVFEFQNAADPLPGSPSSVGQKRLRYRIMNLAPTISKKQAALLG